MQQTRARRSPPGPALLILSALAVLLGGCVDEEAHFAATITADEACMADFFPFEPDFFAASSTEFGTIIRLQSDSRVRTRADAFYITIARDNPILGECPEPDELAGKTVEVAPGGCVQAFFRLNDSCRNDFLDPQVFGQVAFERVGFSRGDVIEGAVTGSLEDFKIGTIGADPVERRTPLGTVEGRFRFEVEVGPAYQLFSTDNRVDRP